MSLKGIYRLDIDVILENCTITVWGTRFSMLDCHVLKGFGIYMIGILDRRY